MSSHTHIGRGVQLYSFKPVLKSELFFSLMCVSKAEHVVLVTIRISSSADVVYMYLFSSDS